MTTQTVQASFMLSTGEVVDLESSLTDGTEGELKVSTDYAVAATSIGQFADGKVITQIIQPVQGATGITYAYLDRRGEILMVLPVSCAGVESQPVMPYSMPVLQAGDTIRVLCNVADTRTFAYNVITNTGVHAIFTGTPSGAANTALTHIKSGQGLGQSLTGQTIVRHMSTSVDGAKLDSAGGVYILNDRGLPVGGNCATKPQNLQPQMSNMGGASIALNFVARVTTNA
jgi:hypothetical protein